MDGTFCNIYLNLFHIHHIQDTDRIWHSPQLKQGDSCFYHYCIDEYFTVLQCLTQCPQAMFILFPYALRYSFSSLCRLHLQCFFQNINACIRIPVMNCMAFRALPDTNAQIFYPWISVAARAAGLTARIHRWYSVKFISIPAGFMVIIQFRSLLRFQRWSRLHRFRIHTGLRL